MRKKVAFVLYEYPLGVSSMIVNSIKMFAKKGIHVDVFVNKSSHELLPVEFTEENISVVVYDDKFSFFGRVFFFFHSRIERYLLTALRRLRKFASKNSLDISWSFLFLYYVRDLIYTRWISPRLTDYDYVFPVEAKSLIVTANSGAKIIYYNMELLDWAEVNPVYGPDKILLKELEFRAITKVDGVVIQNQQRSEQFRKVNDYKGKTYLLPVAAVGESIHTKSTFFREKFAIPSDTCLVIYSGNIMPWANCLEIVESVKNWPENFHLVVHTWRRNVFESGYGMEVKQAAKGLPVHISEDYMDLEQLAERLSSADIALMFYEPIDANFVEILFSSNKLAEYLKAGLPVVTNATPELGRFFQSEGIGETITIMEELPVALTKIAGDYRHYQENVLQCYQNRFRFENYFLPFYDVLYPEE